MRLLRISDDRGLAGQTHHSGVLCLDVEAELDRVPDRHQKLSTGLLLDSPFSAASASANRSRFGRVRFSHINSLLIRSDMDKKLEL